MPEFCGVHASCLHGCTSCPIQLSQQHGFELAASPYKYSLFARSVSLSQSHHMAFCSQQSDMTFWSRLNILEFVLNWKCHLQHIAHLWQFWHIFCKTPGSSYETSCFCVQTPNLLWKVTSANPATQLILSVRFHELVLTSSYFFSWLFSSFCRDSIQWNKSAKCQAYQLGLLLHLAPQV